MAARLRKTLEEVAALGRAVGADPENPRWDQIRAWCERHDLYIDDLGDVRAMVHIIKKAAFLACEALAVRRPSGGDE